MAAPTRQSLTPTSFGAAATAFVIDVGTPTEGNGLVLFFASGDDGATGTMFSIDQDWTEIAEVGNNPIAPFNSCECTLVAYYKTAGASETDPTITKTGLNAYGEAAVIELSGQAASFINQSLFGETSAGSTTELVAGEVTTDVDDCIVYAAFASNESSGTTWDITGTGWTEIAQYDIGNSWNACMIIAEKTMSGQGATVNCTATPGANKEGCYAQVAIEPAAGGDAPLVLYTSPGLSVTNP